MAHPIPTNIITGFLGVGKTTAIRHLLEHKPEGEVWSVLVNEFGEIGIDGALLAASGAHVREVPGGCICCVGNLPMSLALNKLIVATKPDRILIEPTGLGHPAEIIQILTGGYYQSVLDLRATLTLVDARRLSDPRYTDNRIFNDQLQVADVLIANKTDLADPADLRNFQTLLAESRPTKEGSQKVTQGTLDLAWLDRSRTDRVSPRSGRQNNPLQPKRELPNPTVEIPEGQNFLRRSNQGQGHYSCGWAFVPDMVFDFDRVFALLSGLAVPRAKAIMITGDGIFSFNMENGVLSVNELDETMDSRVELVDNKPINGDLLEQQLLDMAGS